MKVLWVKSPLNGAKSWVLNLRWVEKNVYTKAGVCVLTKDLRWINEVVRVKVKSKLVDVRIIENMEFNVDFDPESDGDDHSSWVFESASDNNSADSFMEDEQSDEDEECRWLTFLRN